MKVSIINTNGWPVGMCIAYFIFDSKVNNCCFCFLYVDRSSVELSSDEDGSVSMKKNSETLNTAQCISQMYRKSLRLTSEQIVRITSNNIIIVVNINIIGVVEFSQEQLDFLQFGNKLKHCTSESKIEIRNTVLNVDKCHWYSFSWLYYSNERVCCITIMIIWVENIVNVNVMKMSQHYLDISYWTVIY